MKNPKKLKTRNPISFLSESVVFYQWFLHIKRSTTAKEKLPLRQWVSICLKSRELTVNKTFKLAKFHPNIFQRLKPIIIQNIQDQHNYIGQSHTLYENSAQPSPLLFSVHNTSLSITKVLLLTPQSWSYQTLSHSAPITTLTKDYIKSFYDKKKCFISSATDNPLS